MLNLLQASMFMTNNELNFYNFADKVRNFNRETIHTSNSRNFLVCFMPLLEKQLGSPGNDPQKLLPMRDWLVK